MTEKPKRRRRHAPHRHTTFGYDHFARRPATTSGVGGTELEAMREWAKSIFAVSVVYWSAFSPLYFRQALRRPAWRKIATSGCGNRISAVCTTMIVKQDSWGIVLAGHWNRMIFTPEWVGSRLFHQEEIETQIALLPIFPVVYRHENVVLEASAGRLIFRPRFNNDVSLTAAEEMAVTTLEDLPNTPLIGVGINFSFVEPEPPPALLELFNLNDGGSIARNGWETVEVKVARKLAGEHGTMNFSLGYDNAQVAFEFNFHKDTPGNSAEVNAAAVTAVRGRVTALRDTAVQFLAEIYNLHLEER